jgi:hypothetical protein
MSGEEKYLIDVALVLLIIVPGRVSGVTTESDPSATQQKRKFVPP